MTDSPHFRQPLGLEKTLGLEIAEWEPGRCVMTVAVEPRHLNRSGVLHGGILSTLLDQSMSLSGLYCAEPGRVRKAITLSMTTSFTGQCSAGLVRAVGTLKAEGTRIYNTSGEVFGPDGQLLAMGQGTFRRRQGSVDPAGEPV